MGWVAIGESEARAVATLLHRVGDDTRRCAHRLATITQVPSSVPAGLESMAIDLEGWGEELQRRLARLAVAPTLGWSPLSIRPATPPKTRLDTATTAFSLLHLLGVGSTAYELLGAAFGTEPHPLLLDQWLRVQSPALAARREHLSPALITVRRNIETLEAELAELTPQITATTTSARLGAAHAAHRQSLLNQISEFRKQADQLLARWAPTTDEVTRYLDSLDHTARNRLLFSMLALMPATLPPWLDPYRQAELSRLRAEQAVHAYMGGSQAYVDPASQYMGALAETHGLATLDEQRASFLDRLDPHLSGFWEGLTWGLVAGPYAPARQRSVGGTIGQLLGEVLAGELVVGDLRDLIHDLSHRDYGMAGVDLLGFLPWAGSAKHGDEVATAVRRHDELFDTARRADPLADITDRAAATTEQLAAYSATLREARRGKGYFGLGSATASDADLMGIAWVGPNHVVSSDGTALLSADGLRQYRPPAAKERLGIVQANFEQRFVPTGPWQANGHLEIVGVGPGTAP